MTVHVKGSVSVVIHQLIELNTFFMDAISKAEINLLRPEVNIAFNILRNRHISLLCM